MVLAGLSLAMLAAPTLAARRYLETEAKDIQAAFAKWLRPETLRQQFILTEVLQPPRALRPWDDLA